MSWDVIVNVERRRPCGWYRRAREEASAVEKLGPKGPPAGTPCKEVGLLVKKGHLGPDWNEALNGKKQMGWVD